MWTLMLNQCTLILRFTMILTSSIRQDLTWAWVQLASNSFTSILVKSTCLKRSCIIRLCLSQIAGWIECSIQLLGFWDGREDMSGDEYGQGHDASLSPPSHHYLQVTWSHFLLFCLIELHYKNTSFVVKKLSAQNKIRRDRSNRQKFVRKVSPKKLFGTCLSQRVILLWLGFFFFWVVI